MKRKIVLWEVVGMFVVISLAIAQTPLPNVAPGEAWRGNGISIKNDGQLGTLGLTASDLLRLTYDASEIPGYTLKLKLPLFPYEKDLGSHHTNIASNAGNQRIYSFLSRGWVQVENVRAFQARAPEAIQRLQALRAQRVQGEEYADKRNKIGGELNRTPRL